MHTHTHRFIAFLCVAASLAAPSVAVADGTESGRMAALFAAGQPFEQDFVLTAYYSPKPDQCCYIKGSYEDDMILNGRGTNGADGTPVYPGMIAAPGSYPFGTRVELPGIGIVTVHDRGGAIQMQEKGHRLDVWLGPGEDGLARAYTFGVKRVRGTVYPPQSEQPAERLSLADFPAPPSAIQGFRVDPSVIAAHEPQLGEKSDAVKAMQEKLLLAGYFTGSLTGLFGPVTRAGLEAFARDAGLDDITDSLTERAAAYLDAFIARRTAREPIPLELTRESPPQDVVKVQRTLRFLGYYNGRTDGKFSDTLAAAIMSVQTKHALIRTDQSPGAGRVGPRTRAAILREWRRVHMAMRAERMLAERQVTKLLAVKEKIIHSFLSKGDKGDQVRTLQSYLASKGHLPSDRVTGTFGNETEQALIRYQIQSGIIENPTEQGAGRVGPATLARMQEETSKEMIAKVRAEGWSVL